MENASKALVMAGGVLIAIMVIATLLYAASTWGLIPQQQEDLDEVKQLVEFNQQYESYYRNAVYGIDLISVINKAVDNNNKYNATDKNDMMYIFIEFNINTLDVEPTEEYYCEYADGPKKGNKIKLEEISPEDTDEYKKISEYIEKKTSNKQNNSFKISIGEYSIDSEETKELLSKINKSEDKIENQGTGKVKIKEDNKTYKYIKYHKIKTSSSEFKRRVFKCTKIEYNSEGRVNYMKFEERNTTDDQKKYEDGKVVS